MSANPRGVAEQLLLCVSAALTMTSVLGCGSGVNAGPASPYVSCVAATDSILVGQATNVTATATSPLGSPVTVKFDTSAGSLTPQGTSALIRATSATPDNIAVTCRATDQSGLSSLATAKIAVKTPATTPPAGGPSRTPTLVELSTPQSDLVENEPLQLATSVKASGASPTGNISVKDENNVVLATNAIESSGNAAMSIPRLSVGKHSLVAEYAGNTAYEPSTSRALVVQVRAAASVAPQAASTTTITVLPNPAVVGDAVRLRVAVTSPSTTLPTGTVKLQMDHGASGVLRLTSATATIQLTFPAAATHVFEAWYSGDAQTSASTAAPLLVQVSPKLAPSTTTLNATPLPMTVGSLVMLTASVAAKDKVAAGSVSFLDSGKLLGTALLDQAGSASYTVPSFTPGSHSLSAQYAGSATVAASTSNVLTTTAQLQLPPAPVISCIATPTTLQAGAKAVVAAKVLTSAAAPVKFSFATSAGVVLQQGDEATLDSTGLPDGTVQVTCTATDSYNQRTSKSSAIQVSTPVLPTVTTLTSATNTIQLNQTATLRVAITATSGSVSGPVTFMDGTTVLGTGTASSGTATFSTASLTVGDHPLTARFAGSKGFAASSSSVMMLTVKALPIKTTTTLVVPASVVTGSPITLSSTVRADSGVPTGVVQFYRGATLLGSGNVLAGAATLVVPSVPAGSYSLTAQYNGSTTMASSSSSISTLTVSEVPSRPTVQCTPSTPSLVQGGRAVITASAASAAKLPVTISFSTDKGSLSVSGSTATLDTTGVGPGVVTVTCTATDTRSSTASTIATVQVNSAPLPTTTSLMSSPLNLFSGRAANLSVIVSAASGSVAGQVTLLDGSAVLGTAVVTGGTATFSTTSLAAGSHKLVAQFTGSAGFAASTSSVLAVTVAPVPAAPAVTCSAMPTAVNVGDTVMLTSTVSSPSGRPVTLTMKSSAGQLNVSGTSATLSTAGLQPGPLTFQCEGVDDLGQKSTVTSSAWINTLPGEQAKTAFTFIDSVGVNVHLHYNNTPYAENFPGVLASMKALGVRHYRSGIDPHAYDWEYANAEKLAAAGIKADWLIDRNDTANDINAIARNAPNSIEFFEGPNEDDADVGQFLTNFTKLLHTTVRSNPATANIPIIAPTMIQLDSVAAQPPLASWVDFGNMHDYYTPRHPETAPYGGSFFSCGPYGSMDFNTCVATVTAPGRPVVSTETGYISGTMSDEVLGKYIARTLFLHLNKGVMRTYLYEFADEVFSPNFGLVHEDLTPKPAYTGLKNLMSLFSDDSSATPAKIDYSLSNTTADLQHSLFQKHDGTILLVLWRGVSSANPMAPYQTYNVAAQQVSVRMGSAAGNVTIYNILANGDISQSASPLTSVPVGDGITVISFAPVGR